jgi:hypothetical protein
MQAALYKGEVFYQNDIKHVKLIPKVSIYLFK